MINHTSTFTTQDFILSISYITDKSFIFKVESKSESSDKWFKQLKFEELIKIPGWSSFTNYDQVLSFVESEFAKNLYSVKLEGATLLLTFLIEIENSKFLKFSEISLPKKCSKSINFKESGNDELIKLSNKLEKMQSKIHTLELKIASYLSNKQNADGSLDLLKNKHKE